MEDYTQIRFLEEHAENILNKFEKKIGTEIFTPIPVQLVAEKLYNCQCVPAELDNRNGGASGVLLEDEKIILVNNHDSEVRKRFTIAHEIGHITLPDFDNPDAPIYYRLRGGESHERKSMLKERACERVASAILMPRKLLHQELKSIAIINDVVVANLAVAFNVSQFAMLIRIKQLRSELRKIIDWNSLEDLEIHFRVVRKNIEQTKHSNQKFNPGEYILDPNVYSEVEQVLFNYLLHLGVIKKEFRNGQVRVEINKSPRDVLKRPLTIEFAGSPNSGKDTQIEIIADYLRDYRGFKVLVVDEVYHQSKIRNRHDYTLLWMLATTIRNLVEVADDEKFDVVIINRGLFDILAFVDLYQKLGFISKKEKITHSTTLTTKRLLNLVDIVFLLETTPEESVQREKIYPRKVTDKLAEKLDAWNPNPTPTLSNNNGINMINESYKETLSKYGDAFKFIYALDDNGNLSVEDVAIELGTQLHSKLPKNENKFNKEILLRRKRPKEGDQLTFFDKNGGFEKFE